MPPSDVKTELWPQRVTVSTPGVSGSAPLSFLSRTLPSAEIWAAIAVLAA